MGWGSLSHRQAHSCESRELAPSGWGSGRLPECHNPSVGLWRMRKSHMALSERAAPGMATSCGRSCGFPVEDHRVGRGAGTRPDEKCPLSELSQGRARRASGVDGLDPLP